MNLIFNYIIIGLWIFTILFISGVSTINKDWNKKLFLAFKIYSALFITGLVILVLIDLNK